jgi:hypothetical protein
MIDINCIDKPHARYATLNWYSTIAGTLEYIQVIHR